MTSLYIFMTFEFSQATFICTDIRDDVESILRSQPTIFSTLTPQRNGYSSINPRDVLHRLNAVSG